MVHVAAAVPCNSAEFARKSCICLRNSLARDLRNHAGLRAGRNMTAEQVELVQRTWRAVLPVGDTAAELFYGKLFSLDAGLRPLFRNDLLEQGRNLTSMI